jgi:hypothetical protein
LLSRYRVQRDAACHPAMALPWAYTRATLDNTAATQDCDQTDPQGRRRGPQVPHGTLTRWLEGCGCDGFHEAQNAAARARFRRRAQERLPAGVRQQLLDAIYSGQPFRTILRDLGLSSNQVFGLAKTDDEWSEQLEAALTATRRDDLNHGTTSAYVRGCVCSECRAHQRTRMARNRG